jgi:hypothetical protein
MAETMVTLDHCMRGVVSSLCLADSAKGKQTPTGRANKVLCPRKPRMIAGFMVGVS